MKSTKKSHKAANGRPVVLTIAGLDPSGGAGLVADSLRIARAGCHPVAVASALTIQTPRGVSKCVPVDLHTFRQQLRSLFREMPIRAVKTGLLPSAGHLRAVAAEVPRGVPLVVDPVLASSGGFAFLDEPGIRELLRTLIPRATIVTPNLDEAEILSQICVHSAQGRRHAAAALVELGARVVLVKGGHGGGRAVIDVIATDLGKRVEIEEFRTPRLAKEAHGTGCALSAICAARLALGDSPHRALARARALMRRDLRRARPLGAGRPLLGL